MNIEKIKQAINSGMPDEAIEAEMIRVIAGDDRALSLIFQIVQHRQQVDRELISSLNLLLSKAHVALEDRKFNKGGFIQKEIRDFYEENKGVIGHCFNM
jgi:hypothetical protein